jgi:uracil-DNA glycosylase family 4
MELFTDSINHLQVPGEGPLDAKIAIIGEAAGTREREQRRPFVGNSGQELNKLLHSNGLIRSDLYLTNVIKEQPPGNDISQFIKIDKKGTWVSPKAEMYLELLKEELSQCQANVLVPMGNTALWALTGLIGILKWRGSVLESSLLPGRKIVPTIHPRAVLPPTGVYLWRYLIGFDLRRAKKESEFPEIRSSNDDLIVAPNFTLAESCLQHILVGATTVDVDIEVMRGHVSCIGFAWEDEITTHALCIPFLGAEGNYYSPDQEASLWKFITRIMEDPLLIKRGQNILFDSFFLLQKHGIRTTNMLDTMIAQGIALPDFPKGLDFIASVYTDLPYYKDEGKQWKKLTVDWKQLWEYNCKDTLATRHAWPKLLKELEQQHNLPTYERQAAILEPLAFMQQRGIRIDSKGLSEAHQSVEKALEETTQQLYSLCGFELNPNSPAQLRRYFYETLGLAPYKNRKTKNDSVNADALKRLARKGRKEASILLEIRKLSKLKGTYLEIKFDEDQRLRCSYNPVGTESGRLSSSQTIFGTGANLQNIPYEIRNYMLFDAGYIGYNIDLSQAENRIVAYVGPVPEMMRAFEENWDVHKLTAAMIYSKPLEDISSEERQWGKRANHGLNYDLGFRTFALYYEIDEASARFIVDRYHQAYPGVRQGYHQQVRQMLSTSRTVTNCMGRNRVFLDRWGDELFKSAYSFIPQSTVADIINERGLSYIYQNQSDFSPVELLLQIHDSIVFQIPRSVPLAHHAAILWKIKKSLETPLKWKLQTFSIPAEIELSTRHMGKGVGGLVKIQSTSEQKLLDDLTTILGRL